MIFFSTTLVYLYSGSLVLKWVILFIVVNFMYQMLSFLLNHGFYKAVHLVRRWRGGAKGGGGGEGKDEGEEEKGRKEERR